MPTTPVQKASESLLSRLRFPQLFVLFAALFVADMFLIDPLPFVDEIMLGILTLMTAMWRKDRNAERAEEAVAGGSKPPEKNVTPDA